MKRTWPIIGLSDVPGSFNWYQTLFGQTETAPAHGQKEPMHSHPPGVVYVFSEAKFRSTAADGSISEGPSAAGEVHWRDFTTHAAENIGETEAHALAVELKPCR